MYYLQPQPQYWIILDQYRLVAYRYWTSFSVIAGTDIHWLTGPGPAIAKAIATTVGIAGLTGLTEKSDVDRHWSAENSAPTSVGH